MKMFFFMFLFGGSILKIFSQSAPAADENIPYLVTFGGESKTSWGDDDFCQVFFFLIPASQTDPVFIRIYDPDTGGDLDEQKGLFNTVVSYSVYGGNGCWSDEDAQSVDPIGNYKSGILLATRNFGISPDYNLNYFTFGPFNPFEGEYVEKFDARVFKVIARGESGDDGNLYRYFLSSEPDRNSKVEGGNIFTYEYTFRLSNNPDDVSQIYPFVDDKTISIEISNFDWDNDGQIKLYSVAKNGISCDISNEDHWIKRNFQIVEEERNTTVEVQFLKNKNIKVLNNNVVVVVKNQYGISLPFFVVPIGGIPVYTPKIRMKEIQ